MNKTRIAIGNDHAGTDLKFRIIEKYGDRYEFVNKGTDNADSVDYPDHVHPVANAVTSGDAAFGILICGSGNGVCMTANKHRGIRAGLAWTPEIAALAKQHNNANIICLPARFLTTDQAIAILDAYLHASFDGGRHQGRIEKIPC